MNDWISEMKWVQWPAGVARPSSDHFEAARRQYEKYLDQVGRNNSDFESGLEFVMTTYNREVWWKFFFPVGGIPVHTTMNIFGDNIGYVKMVDRMGDDFTPAEDARTSTDKGRLGPEKDTALQERLMTDNHTSPFEGVIVKFEVAAPLFVIREADRHRTVDKNNEDDPFEIVGPEENLRKWFARNEMSGRYIQMPDLYYHPVTVRGQSTTNKQGGGQDMVSISPGVAEEFKSRGLAITRQARELYNWGVEQGIEKGMARIYNTQNQYTRIRYTGSLKNWFDALKLRLPNVVLWECRVVFEAIRDILKAQFPQAMSSWEELVYNGVKLTGPEKDLTVNLIRLLQNTGTIVESDNVKKLLKKLGV